MTLSVLSKRSSTATRIIKICFIFLILISYYYYYNTFVVSSLQYVIKVCQNKHCVKKFPNSSSGENLMNVFRTLLHEEENGEGEESKKQRKIVVESSGCLSKCEYGPNISIRKSSSSSLSSSNKEVNGILDAYTVADILKVECQVDCPPILLAAADVFQQANQSNSPHEKETLLSSVIQVLENTSTTTSPNYSQSYALVTAFIQRANARLMKITATASLGQQPTDENANGALSDSYKAIQIISGTMAMDYDNNNNNKLVQNDNYDTILTGKAWKVYANANEACGNYIDAIYALRMLSTVDPSFKSKVKNEIDRLSSLLLS